MLFFTRVKYNKKKHAAPPVLHKGGAADPFFVPGGGCYSEIAAMI